jgi:hypothetical protein
MPRSSDRGVTATTIARELGMLAVRLRADPDAEAKIVTALRQRATRHRQNPTSQKLPNLRGKIIMSHPSPLSTLSGALKIADKVTVAMEAVGNKIRVNSQGWEDARVIDEPPVLTVVAIKGQLHLLPEHTSLREQIKAREAHQAESQPIHPIQYLPGQTLTFLTLAPGECSVRLQLEQTGIRRMTPCPSALQRNAGEPYEH